MIPACPLSALPRGEAVRVDGDVPIAGFHTEDGEVFATYRLLPRSSFADYVARWLLDAMPEFASDFRDGGGS